MGSAVQRSFLKINDAVLEGGDTLASFAETAGMSSEEFQKAWQDDAAQALIPFLEGLNETHEAGGNVNSILRDLGITSVNELNTLLVLAGGYDQLAGNLEMASDAYNETEESMMALNEEAELAYGTTLGKLRTAWNRLKDSLIDIGEPIADAVIDMVDAADPIFETIENIATGFSEMDESAQRDILNTVAKIALIAPALKLAGGTMTTLGDIGQAITPIVRKSGEIITGAFTGVSDEASTLADTAQTAGGAKGVGGLVKILSGSGAGALPWALGIAAAALGGWALWKTWGEDAYEAARQTREWGTAVTDETEDVLTDIQETGGMWNLMQQGVEEDTALLIGDFQKMGQSIEDDINRRLEITGNFLGDLPEQLRSNLEEILGDYYENMEETLEVVETNNEKIAEINKRASDENRDRTEEELAYIRELQRHSADEYIQILNLNAEEEKSIRAALAGDLDDISKEQTSNLIARLNDEQVALNQQRTETIESTKELLRELGLENTAVGEELLAGVEQYYEQMGITGKRTMYELFQLYPELAETHDLATGEMLSTSETRRQAQEANNRRLIESWEEYGFVVEDTASKAVDANSLIVDNSRAGAEAWNDAVAKSGGEMDKFKENIQSALDEGENWNHFRFQMHEANLDSNAKQVMLEVAIENGYWDGMAWEDKELLLKDEFSQTVYEGVQHTEMWNNLTPEEKIAILTDDFTTTVITGIMQVGEWNKLTPEQQKLIATTNSPETLRQVLEDIGVWETLPIAIRELLADSTDVDKEVRYASQQLNEYGQVIATATLNADDQTRTGVESARRQINSLPSSKTTTLTTVRRTIKETYRRAGNSASSQRAAQAGYYLNARGTDFHPGGLAMVNDQQGATFRELVTLPDGSSFVPSGRDVLLDLPKGSKVLRAALTKMKFPDIKQYQDGVGYSRQQTQQIMNGNNVDMSQTNSLLNTLISLISSGQDISINVDGKQIARSTVNYLNNENDSKMNYGQRGLAINEL